MALYLLPIAGTGATQDARHPAYIATDVPGVPYAMMDYGMEPVCLLHMMTSPAQDAALKTHADVFSLPATLDQTVGAQLGAIQAALATFNIPEQWVRAGMTYRQVLRLVVLIFQFMQRLATLTPARLFTGGVTLATRFNQLAPETRAVLQQAAEDLGFDTTGLTGAITLRILLKTLADQFTLDALMIGEDPLQ